MAIRSMALDISYCVLRINPATTTTTRNELYTHTQRENERVPPFLAQVSQTI